ncbi:MAG: hypothetical protein V3W34_04560 [Phycisphaerae bacterium]
MLVGVRRRHEHADVLAYDLLGCITEHPLGRRIEHFDHAVGVDEDDPIHRGFQDRAQMGGGVDAGVRPRRDALAPKPHDRLDQHILVRRIGPLQEVLYSVQSVEHLSQKSPVNGMRLRHKSILQHQSSGMGGPHGGPCTLITPLKP